MEDNVRAPLANRRLNLYDPYDGQSIEDYVRKINNDNTIDQEMKDILIQSRREFLGLHKSIKESDMSILNNEIIVRASKVSGLVELFDSNPEIKNILHEKMNMFIGLDFDYIKLEPPEYIKVFELIEKFNFNIETLRYFKEKIIPYDLQLLNEYKLVIEKTKREQEEIINKSIEIESRTRNVQVFNIYICKLKLDPAINKLAKSLEPKIEDYITLNTSIIQLDSELSLELGKFIRSIRIKDSDLKIITQIFSPF